MGQQQYASTMTATTAMVEMAKAMAMAMAMETATPMMPPLSTAKILMMTTAAIQGRRLDVDDGTTLMYVNDDGDNGDGDGEDGDGNGNGNGNGNSNDAAAAAVGITVDEDDCGALKTAIVRWRLDNNNGTTTM
jgi:hypothetical protein